MNDSRGNHKTLRIATDENAKTMAAKMIIFSVTRYERSFFFRKKKKNNKRKIALQKNLMKNVM